MKINDTTLKQDRGGIWICRKRSDGTVKDTDRINVTEEVIEMFCELCKAEKGKAMLYNRNGKAFEIHVKELSQEEVTDINAEKARKGRKVMADIMGVYPYFLQQSPDMPMVLKVAKQEGLIK